MIRIEIPYLPPKALSPNSRSHWATKARASKSARRDAYLCAQATRADGQGRFIVASLKITITVKDQRYVMDTDNALASCKPFIDGCVDAAIVPNDDPSHLMIRSVEYVVDKTKAPMTVLEFSR